jgi:hypothetical protein
MREALTAVDIRELLISFDAAIESDQLRVDALPPLGKPRNETTRALMMQWLPVTDPLRIAQDEECGYGTPAGLVS